MAKVLVADDDASVREETAAALESLGHRVVRVADLDRTVETAAAERPDLVLPHVHGAAGAHLVADLRARAETAEVPVVFFSSRGEGPSGATRYDAWGHLTLPSSPDEVERLVERVLHPPPVEEPVPEVRRNVRAYFHDYWNLLAALGNYIQVLEGGKRLAPEPDAAVQSLGELTLKLEAKTDRLRTFLIGLVDSLEAPEPPPRNPRAPAAARPPDGKPRRGRPKGPPRTTARPGPTP